MFSSAYCGNRSVFTVIHQHEALAMPAPERDLILRCRIGNTIIHSQSVGCRHGGVSIARVQHGQ